MDRLPKTRTLAIDRGVSVKVPSPTGPFEGVVSGRCCLIGIGRRHIRQFERLRRYFLEQERQLERFEAIASGTGLLLGLPRQTLSVVDRLPS